MNGGQSLAVNTSAPKAKLSVGTKDIKKESIEINNSVNEVDFVEYDGNNLPPSPDLSSYSPAYYLSITGNTEVVVRDEAGNTASIENGLLNNQVQGLSNYEITGENSILLTLSTGHTYSVEFRAGGFPAGIELVKGRGNLQPTLAVRYNDLNIPANSNVKLTVSQNDMVDLKFDANNDGDFETTVLPTANLSGTAASDTTPPNVNVSVVQQGNTATATITVQDNQSGIGRIWYSLDGQTFQPYTSALTLQYSSNSITIYSFADDLAANRSNSFSQAFVFTQPPTLAVRPILECVAPNPNGTYTARFGYENYNSSVVVIPLTEKNKFTPVPKNRGQVTTFQPGRVINAFSVTFDENNLKWHLTGPNGIQQNVSASRNSPICQ